MYTYYHDCSCWLLVHSLPWISKGVSANLKNCSYTLPYPRDEISMISKLKCIFNWFFLHFQTGKWKHNERSSIKNKRSSKGKWRAVVEADKERARMWNQDRRKGRILRRKLMFSIKIYVLKASCQSLASLGACVLSVNCVSFYCWPWWLLLSFKCSNLCPIKRTYISWF